jgi:hypothetical protein
MSGYAIVNLLEIDDSVAGNVPELIAVGGPKPEGGDGVTSDTPWPDASGS